MMARSTRGMQITLSTTLMSFTLSPVISASSTPLISVSKMPRPTAAARLLVVPLPLSHSLPQIIPPFKLRDITEIVLPATGLLLSMETPEPAQSQSNIDSIVDTIPIDSDLPPILIISIPLESIFSDPLLVPTETLAPETPSPASSKSTVSVQHFRSVVQPLLDLIRKLTSTETPLETAQLSRKEKRQWPWIPSA